MNLNISGIGLDPLSEIDFVEDNRVHNESLLAVKKDGSLKVIERKTVNCGNEFLAFFGGGKLKELSYTIGEVQDAVKNIIKSSGKAIEIRNAVDAKKQTNQSSDAKKQAVQSSDESDPSDRIITSIIEIQKRAKR